MLFQICDSIFAKFLLFDSVPFVVYFAAQIACSGEDAQADGKASDTSGLITLFLHFHLSILRKGDQQAYAVANQASV